MIFNIEYILQQEFEDYNVILSEGTGRTEFFNSEILKSINIVKLTEIINERSNAQNWKII